MGSTLDGVTTAVVLFLFACLVIPNFIKNRPQYFAALGAVLGIILINTVALMIGNVRFNVFVGVIVGFLQLVAVLMLVMCCGGMTMSSIASEMGHAYEVMRRGEDEKEVIIPLTGMQPGVKKETPTERIEIVSPEPAENKSEPTQSSES